MSMDIYFYQDVISVALGFLLLLVILGKTSLSRSSFLLLLLTLLLSLAGLTDFTFRWNPNAVIVLLADSINVFCFLFSLAIYLHYSFYYLYREKLQKYYWLIYVPSLAVFGFYILTPIMIKGITHSALGFQLSYGPLYWLLLMYGIIYLLLVILCNAGFALNPLALVERERSLYLLFSLFLMAYFYSSVIIFPYLYSLVNFASPLPAVFSALVLVYGNIRYRYFEEV